VVLIQAVVEVLVGIAEAVLMEVRVLLLFVTLALR
jgi:hypothetical protein